MLFRESETTIKIEFALFRGGGVGRGAERKIAQNAIFHGKRHDNKILNVKLLFPEGPARQIDVSRQKSSPHCLEAIFDSQPPSPKLSPKMPPKLSPPQERAFYPLSLRTRRPPTGVFGPLGPKVLLGVSERVSPKIGVCPKVSGEVPLGPDLKVT